MVGSPDGRFVFTVTGEQGGGIKVSLLPNQGAMKEQSDDVLSVHRL
jgi:hypothetical protein